jgi:hypothetical protein
MEVRVAFTDKVTHWFKSRSVSFGRSMWKGGPGESQKPVPDWFHFPMQIVVGAYAVYWWHWHSPAPNIAVLALASVAALMVLADMRPIHKVLYVVIIVSLVLIESRAIKTDRANFARDEACRRNEENRKIQNIANELKTSIEQNQRQFLATMSGFKETIGTVTGGDTFCYLDVFGEQIPLSTVSLRKMGKYGLSDVTVKLLVSHPFPNSSPGQTTGNTGITRIGDIAAFDRPSVQDIPLAQFNLEDQENVDFNIVFSARNGIWHQLLYLRRVGGLKPGGRWLKATRVFRIKYGSKPYEQARMVLIFERIDDKFPVQEISWNDWLLYDH